MVQVHWQSQCLWRPGHRKIVSTSIRSAVALESDRRGRFTISLAGCRTRICFGRGDDVAYPQHSGNVWSRRDDSQGSIAGFLVEIGPLFAGLLVAGRVSAGIGAVLANMRATEQIDAIETISIDSSIFWLFLVLSRVSPPFRSPDLKKPQKGGNNPPHETSFSIPGVQERGDRMNAEYSQPSRTFLLIQSAMPASD